ncbi:MAG TPA: protein kinase [Kofleriaceae bacterium]|nr:protein kinase [Kofleriaceae bacterium]
MQRFGKYELIRRIGSGGMAEVYLARTSVAQGLEKKLVIKKIHPAFARSEQFMAMFVDEAKIALGLNHANIVQVFDFGTTGESFFLAMEHIEGADLLRVMREAYRRGLRVPFGLGAYIVQQVAKGLDYAHRKTDEAGLPLGIVHRDVSPQNVLVSHDGAVKIVDFGIARARHVHEDEGVVKGKFGYMAPEQARGERVDRRADIYSAGVVLFELACGRPLYPGKGKAVLEAVKSGAIPRPRTLDPELPPVLEEVIVRALAYHPGDRFQTARDLQRALGQFQLAQSRGDEPIDSGALARFLARTIPPRRRGDGRAPSAGPGITSAGSPARRRRLSLVEEGLSLDGAGASSTENHAEVREIKHVFVVPARIAGWDACAARIGPIRADAILRDLGRITADIAFKHHAEVGHIGADGITVVIGLPALAEDDASRAIRVALALIDALDGITIDVSPTPRLAVGIERHAASVRRAGVRYTYQLAGDRAAIAERLARGAQGGEVVVGGAVYRAARAEWRFAELSPVAIFPGAEDRARSFRVVGPKDRAERMREAWARPAELFGRDLELKALCDAYRATLIGCEKRHIAILGEDGIGKRSLVAAFLDTIPAHSAVVLHAAARVATTFTPYGIIADLGRDLLDLAEDAAPREVSRRIDLAARLLYPDDIECREALGLIWAANLVLGGEMASSRPMDAAASRRHIIDAIVRVEQRFFPERPLILIADNVHFADAESIEVFSELLASPQSRPVLGIVTMRPRAKLAAKLADAAAEIINLDELDAESSRAMIAGRLGLDPEKDGLVGEIARRAGGHPLFIRELCDALVDRGALAAGSTGRRIAGGDSLGVPDTIDALIATRIDALPLPQRRALLAASAYGREISPRAANALVGDGAADHLSALATHGLLREVPGGFAFKNDMAMAVAYRLIPPAERRALHRRAAEVVLSGGYRPGQDDAIVARHLELCGDAAGAARRYVSAAGYAATLGGHADAARQLARALKLSPATDHDLRFAIHTLRADVCQRLADRPAQLRELHRAHRMAVAKADPEAIAGAKGKLAVFYLEAGKLAQARNSAATALELSRKLGHRPLTTEALRITSLITLAEGQSRAALALADEALALCGDAAEHRGARAETLNARGGCLLRMGRFDEALEAYAEALVIFRMLALPRQEAKSLNNMGVVFANIGELEEALAHYKMSLKIDQDLGDRHAFALKLGNIGQTYGDLGDLGRADRYLAKAIEIAGRTADQGSGIDAGVSLGQVKLAAGDIPGAIAQLAAALAAAEATANRYQQVRALAYLALACLDGGHKKQALDHARRAQAIARDMPMPVGEVYGLAAEGAALAALGRAAEGQQKSAQAVDLLDACPHPTGREHILLLFAQVCEEAGNLADARAAITSARADLEAKIARLRDPELRATYQAARIPKAITAASSRLLGDGDGEGDGDSAGDEG